MRRKSKRLTAAIDVAFEQLERHGGDPARLPVPLRTVSVIVSAQGVIDNGGLRYFFEADFPGAPPYGVFVDAYRAIGATDAADALAEAVALFPFPEPNRAKQEREQFLASFEDEEDDPVDSPFEPLSRRMYGSQGIWDHLDAYVAADSDHFRPRRTTPPSRPGGRPQGRLTAAATGGPRPSRPPPAG